MLYRKIFQKIKNGASSSKPILLAGAYGTGKTTAAKNIFLNGIISRHIRLNDVYIRGEARKDPTGFLENITSPFILDEVWRVPELLVELKSRVANKNLLQTVISISSVDPAKSSDARLKEFEILRLRGLSQGEVEGTPETFADKIFDENFEPATAVKPSETRSSLFERMLRGGYPEIFESSMKSVRRKWFDSYLNEVLFHYVRDITQIENPHLLPILLSMTAKRTGCLLNFADVARSIELPQPTLKNYFSLLEAVFLVETIPAWTAAAPIPRLVKSPKVFLGDTGLLGHLLDLDGGKVLSDSSVADSLTANFVVLELLKQVSWSNLCPRLSHFQTSNGQNVDALLEDSAGRIVGIGIKSTASVFEKDFKGLRVLEKTVGERFLRGIVFYSGTEVKVFNEKLLAIPINHLWNGG